MKNLFQAVLLAASLLVAAAFPVKADGIFNPGSSGGGGGVNGYVTCVTGVCTFTGADGSTQLVVGSTSGAVDFPHLVGGISGAGGSLLCQGSDTNVPCNVTAKGNAPVNGANGSGVLYSGLDPGGPVSTNGQFQMTPSTSNGPTKAGNATYGVNLDCGTAQACQVGGQPLVSQFPGYIATHWYNAGPVAQYGAGSAALNGKSTCYPSIINQKMTINGLGVRISATNAGNAQAAIYASNNATGRPTGLPLIQTASMSTASAVNVSGTLTPTSVQVAPGVYWFCTNIDNATASLISINGAGAQLQNMFGSATQATELGNQLGLSNVSVTETFGTWGDKTSASFTENTTNSTPVVQFEVASVP